MKGEAPAFAGAVPLALRRTGAKPSNRSPICTCPPLVPGWPDAIVQVARIGMANFWGTVSRPFVFRVIEAQRIDDTGFLPEEDAAVLEAGYFVFVVRPGREDADAKALADVLKAQGGPSTFGKPVDLSGEGKMLVQIVAVLSDTADSVTG